MEWSEVDWDAERWTIPAAKMKTGWDHVVPLSRQALAILSSVQKLTGHRRYAFSCSNDAPLSNNTLNKRWRLLGIDTKTDHCAHGFRTTFSTLSHHEEIKDAKAWDGDVVELHLAHLDNSTMEGLYKKHGPLALEVDRFVGRGWHLERGGVWILGSDSKLFEGKSYPPSLSNTGFAFPTSPRSFHALSTCRGVPIYCVTLRYQIEKREVDV
jgi:Phage integrase family